MSLPALDDFNRGVGPVGANWTDQINGLTIDASQRCKGTTAGNYNAGFHNVDTYDDNQYAQTVAITGTAGFGGVQVRASGTGGSRNGYYALYGASASRISKVVNNSITDLVSPGGYADPANSDLVRVEVASTAIRVLIQGVEVAATTDGALASGSAGLILFDTNAIVDDFEGGNVDVGQKFFLTRF